MGDTGSLFLGGLVVGMAFMIGNPLIIIVVGIVYICEAASVILQVGYFKLTHGKRLFKMAPDTSPFREVRLERDKDRRRLLADNPDRGSHISSRSVKKL